MTESRPDNYLEPYRQAVREHGAGFAATLWGNERTQRLRFDVCLDLLGPLDDCALLDVGCGRGDLAAHLIERNLAFGSYAGLDALPDQIAAAQQRGLERCTFHTADFVADAASLDVCEPDFAIISGTLNTMDDPTARGLVERCFDRSAQGVVFNFLSDRPHQRWAGRNLSPARRFNTADWLDWSMRLTSRVAFTQAYLDGHDATILILHDETT